LIDLLIYLFMYWWHWCR